MIRLTTTYYAVLSLLSRLGGEVHYMRVDPDLKPATLLLTQPWLAALSKRLCLERLSPLVWPHRFTGLRTYQQELTDLDQTTRSLTVQFIRDFLRKSHLVCNICKHLSPSMLRIKGIQSHVARRTQSYQSQNVSPPRFSNVRFRFRE